MLQVLICIINLVLYHSIKCCLKSAIYSSPFSSLFIIYSLCLQINPTGVVKTNSLFFFFWFEGYISAVIKVSIMLLLCNRPDMSQTQWEGCKFSCRALQMSLHSQISPYLVLARGFCSAVAVSGYFSCLALEYVKAVNVYSWFGFRQHFTEQLGCSLE